MRRIFFSPWAYGAAYVLLIPVFALLYLRHSEEFFHSTIALEASTSEEADDVAQRLRTAIIDDYVAADGSTKIRGETQFLYPNETWEADIRDLFVSNLDVVDRRDAEEADVTFDLLLPAVGRTGGRDARTTEHLTVSLPVQSPIVLDSTHLKPITSAEVFQEPFPLRDLFPQRHAGATAGFDRPVLRLERDVQDDLVDLWQAQQGLASGIRGSFWRFLYLSAVTITTLGYGDIVPTGPWARFLVGLESVLGIVVIGGFLAALYKSPRDAKRTRSSVGKKAGPD